MIPDTTLRELKALSGTSPYANRILSELHFAEALSKAHDGKYDGCVTAAAEALASAVREDGGVITKSSALHAESLLLPLQDAARAYRIHCVAHAHIDMNWMWGFQETASVTVDTFRTVLNLMREYPELTFAQSQASTYEIIEQYAPEMLEEIKARIREGRWEVSASTWVEADKNMSSGESLARHILYTKRYLSKLLEIPANSLQLDFEPDTFGHNVSVPEICAAGGVKYYYHCRGNAKLAPSVYRWRGRAGSELLVYREPHWYNADIEGDMLWDTPIQAKENGVPCFLKVYGVGDHGGGPTRRDLERLREIASWPIMPTLLFSTYGAYFAELEQYRDTLPVVEGEINFVFDGCYTSQAKIKRANRLAEARIYESEALCTEAAMLGAKDFSSTFCEAWKRILFNQFHDILPGSGVVDTREHAMGKFQDAMAYVGTNANIAMRSIADQIDTSASRLASDPASISEGGGVGYGVSNGEHYQMPQAERGSGVRRLLHFFNPTQYDFDGVSECTVYDWNEPADKAYFTDEDNHPVACKLLEDGTMYWGHHYKKFALHVRVPAFGYATYTLDRSPDQAPTLPLMPLQHERQDFVHECIVLENNHLRAVFDGRTAELCSLIDLTTDTELIKRPSAFFRLITENTLQGMTAWRVGDYMKIENLQQTANVSIEKIDTNGVRKSICFRFDFATRSSLSARITLDENSRFLQYDVTVDFHEVGTKSGIPQLNFALPFAYSASACRYDVPFGTVDRAPLNYDVPASSFAVPLSTGTDQASLMLISDSKYGFRFTDGMLALSLIRASYDPDPYPEYGVHHFRLGIGVCPAHASESELYRMADSFVHPISYCAATAQPHEGTLPFTHQLLRVSENLRVTALKTAEDGQGYVVRFYAPKDSGGEWSIALSKNVQSAFFTDLNETVIAPATFSGNTVFGTCTPNKVCTLLIQIK